MQKQKDDAEAAEAEARRLKELEEKLIQGENSQDSEEEPMIDDVQGASHSEPESDGDKPSPPEITVLPPFNYKAVKTIHYAKFFTSCIFTAEQQLEMTTKGKMLTRERATTQMDTSDLNLPQMMKFFTFYYFFRMCLLDICYLTLGEMPTLQILLPLTLEGIFIAIVIVTAKLSKVFGSKFVVFRLLLQGCSIFLWLLMSYFGIRKSEKFDYRGMRYQEYQAALPDYLSIFMEWLTVFMIMLMLGTEVYWSLKKIYLAVKHSMSTQVAKIKRKKARKQRKKDKELGIDGDTTITQENADYISVKDLPTKVDTPEEKKRDTVRHTRVESGFKEDALRAMKTNANSDLVTQGEKSDEDVKLAPELKKEFKEDGQE